MPWFSRLALCRAWKNSQALYNDCCLHHRAVFPFGATLNNLAQRMSFKFQLAKVMLATLGAVPLSVTRALGGAIGLGLSRGENRNVRIARRNLALCFPELSDLEREQLLRKRMQALGRTTLEMLKIWGASGPSALALIEEVEGQELIEDAKNNGKGIIILAPHLGNWEVIGLFLTECNRVVKSMYSPPKSPTMNQLILHARQRTGATLVPADRSGVIQLLKALKQGDMIGILPDQVPADESGVFAPFFDQPAFSMTLMSNLARKTGAHIVNAYALPTEKGFKVVLSRPDDGIYSEDVEQSVAAMNRTIEQCAAMHREHYQWEYKRFKRQPPGAASVY